MSSNPYGSTSPREGGFTDRPPAGAAPGVIPDPGPRPPQGAPSARVSSGAAGHPPADPKEKEKKHDPADDRPNPAQQAFARLGRDFDELKEYASYYLTTKVDGVKRTARNVGLYAALGVVGLIAGGAIVATAAGLLIVGVAEALTNLFGGRAWLGDIVTGLLVLGLLGLGAYLMMNKLTGTWRSQTVKKYEQRKQSQRERYGHDVSERAGK